MAINVEFYSFSKRINSTKRPDSGAVTYACNMINGFSLTHPVLQIAGANNQFNPTLYNYARIADFNDRYYFVEDWKYDKGLWSAYLAVDELASWKLTIGASQQYITRAASVPYTGPGSFPLIDSKYPTHSGLKEVASETATNYPLSRTVSGGCVLLYTASSGKTTDGIGMSDIWAFTIEEFRKFKKSFYNSDIWSQLDDSVGGNINSIMSVRWYPFSKESLNVKEYQTQTVYLDPMHFVSVDFTPTYVYFLTDNDYLLKFSWETYVPKHPDTDSVGWYLNSNMYATYSYVWYPVGTVPINADFLQGAETITCSIVVDIDNRSAIFTIEKWETVIYSASLQFGCEISMAWNTADAWGIFNSAFGALTNATTKNYGAVANNVFGMVGGAIPQTSVKSGGGNVVTYIAELPKLQAEFLGIVNQDVQRFGKPFYSKQTISGLTGFIQCDGADFKAAGATRAEITAVNNYMNGGFYYE